MRLALRAGIRRPKSFPTILSLGTSRHDRMQLELTQFPAHVGLHWVRLTNVDLMSGSRRNLESRGARHRFDACMVGRPPVGGVVLQLALNESHTRPARAAQPVA